MKRNIVLILIGYSFISSVKAQNWSPVGTGINGVVSAMTVYNGELYVGGRFTEAGSTHVTNIAKWNGTNWSTVGMGTQLYAYINALVVYNGNLYVGGSFDSAGGIVASNIAEWNGTNWSALGAGIKGGWGPPYCLAVYNGNLIVGGGFDTAGGIPANHIASWNGTTWSDLSSGISQNGGVYSMYAYDSVLYVGGGFDSAGGKLCHSIAEWNGATWYSLGTGLRNTPNLLADVAALCIYKGKLYAGGIFDTAGVTPVTTLASWNGAKWDSVVSRALTPGYGFISSMIVTNDILFIGGTFDTVNGINANDIASFNGSKWDSVGSGFINDTGVNVLAVYNSELYAGGYIALSGNTPVRQIARWDYPLGINSITASTNLINLYPNPNDGQFTLSLSNVNTACNVEIYNVLGEKIYSKISLQSQSYINLIGQPDGVYFYRVVTQTGELLGSGKLIIER